MHDRAFGARDVGGPEDLLGGSLIHGHGRGAHAGMGIGNVQNLKEALNAAIFPIATVQGIEDRVRGGRQGLDQRRHVAAHVDLVDIVAGLAQG